MTTNFKYIALRDDDFAEWNFFIDLEKISLNSNIEKEKIKEAIFNFHLDYIKISQQYQLCEIFPQTLLKKYKVSNEEVIKGYLAAIMARLEKGYFNFFALDYIPELLNIFYDVHHSRLNLIHNGEVVNDYFYLLRKKYHRLEILNSLSYTHDRIGGTLLEVQTGEILNLNSKKQFIDEISFRLSTCSEFWLQKAFYGRKQYWEEGYDNSILAYLNTPRLNSFLRDLKDIWINKYGWEVELSESWTSVTEDGILLDGKIIYQEDIDSGKIKLPPLSS